ncbi:MAG: hypothetical protein ACOC9D_00245 [Thermodesulfobacteriota bacterium]
MPRAPLILITPENCRGCRRCEIACSWQDPGPLNPRLAGIHIMKLDNGGIDYPVINDSCQDRFCGKASPGNSGRNIPTCVGACLFEALTINQENEHD